jgi:hypothetical protein
MVGIWRADRNMKGHSMSYTLFFAMLCGHFFACGMLVSLATRLAGGL